VAALLEGAVEVTTAGETPLCKHGFMAILSNLRNFRESASTFSYACECLVALCAKDGSFHARDRARLVLKLGALPTLQDVRRDAGLLYRQKGQAVRSCQVSWITEKVICNSC
jgi:hypothetical protein